MRNKLYYSSRYKKISCIISVKMKNRFHGILLEIGYRGFYGKVRA